MGLTGTLKGHSKGYDPGSKGGCRLITGPSQTPGESRSLDLGPYTTKGTLQELH